MKTLEQFRKEYTEAFKELMKYKPDQAGCLVWCEKMADLADSHPVWTEIVENER